MTQHIVSPAGIRLPFSLFQTKDRYETMIQSIIKRDGRVVLYDQNKIASAVLRSLEASGDGSVSATVVKKNKVGRNDPCPCGSGKKYKHCCGK